MDNQKNYILDKESMEKETSDIEMYRILGLEKKKGNWSKQEDKLLLKWVQTKGPFQWKLCAESIKGRNSKQCRERWANTLNPQVKRGNWTKQEQFLIFQQSKVYWSSWSKIAKVLPGRTENSTKNYFYSTLRRIKLTLIFRFWKTSLFRPDNFDSSKYPFNFFCFSLKININLKRKVSC